LRFNTDSLELKPAEKEGRALACSPLLPTPGERKKRKKDMSESPSITTVSGPDLKMRAKIHPEKKRTKEEMLCSIGSRGRRGREKKKGVGKDRDLSTENQKSGSKEKLLKEGERRDLSQRRKKKIRGF